MEEGEQGGGGLILGGMYIQERFETLIGRYYFLAHTNLRAFTVFQQKASFSGNTRFSKWCVH